MPSITLSSASFMSFPYLLSINVLLLMIVKYDLAKATLNALSNKETWVLYKSLKLPLVMTTTSILFLAHPSGLTKSFNPTNFGIILVLVPALSPSSVLPPALGEEV